MLSASEISLTEAYTPSSSICCHRHARASALTERAIGLRFRDRHDSAAVRCDDALAATAALKSHGMRTISVLLGAVDNAIIFVGC